MSRSQGLETRRRPMPSRERGGALIAVMVFVLLAVTAVILGLKDATARREAVVHQKNRLGALQGAELGLQAAMVKLNTNRTANIDGLVKAVRDAGVVDWDGQNATGEFTLFTEIDDQALSDRNNDGYPDLANGTSLHEQRQNLAKLPDGTIRVRVAKIGDELYRALAAGVDGRQTRVFEAILQPKWDKDILKAGIGMYAGTILNGTDSAYVDSYKSSLGYLASRSDNVVVGSNQTVNITDSTVQINGDIGSALGPSAVSVPASLQDQVLQEKLPEYEMPTPTWTVPTTNSNATFADFAAGIAANGSYRLGSSSPSDVASAVTVGRDGESHALAVKNARLQSTLVIKGHVDLYVDDLTINAGAQIYIAPGASINVYSAGTVSINGHGFVNSTARPKNLQLYSSGGDISMNGSATFVGVTYAPQSEIKINGTLEYFGAVFGDTLNAAGTLDFHFDEDLGGQIGFETRRDPRYSVVGFLEKN